MTLHLQCSGSQCMRLDLFTRPSGLIISREQGLRYDAGVAVPVLMSRWDMGMGPVLMSRWDMGMGRCWWLCRLCSEAVLVTGLLAPVVGGLDKS